MVSEVMANLNIPTPLALNLTTENLADNWTIFHDACVKFRNSCWFLRKTKGGQISIVLSIIGQDHPRGLASLTFGRVCQI